MQKHKMLITALLLIILITVTFYINACIIYNYANTDEKQKSDVIIVLGAATNDNGISPVYRERINHGIWLYNNNYAQYIIVTGGTAKGAKHSDAYHAKQYLLSQGVPEGIIFTEDKSTITRENLKFSKTIMEKMGWKTSIIVSDPLHMKRAVLIGKDYGINPASSPTPTTRYRSFKTKFMFLLRETFFFIGDRLYSFLNKILFLK